MAEKFINGWYKEDMRTEAKQIVDRLAILMKGTIEDALNRFKL